MRKEDIGLLSVCLVALSATVMSVPIAGIMGIIGDAVAQEKQTVLRIGFMQEIDSMNPYMGLNDASYVFYGLVYDALGVIDEDMNPEPDLALSWYPVPTDDPDPRMEGMPYGSVWQYNLTPNAYWTDGEPFTADDVIFNIELNYKNYDSMWAYQPYSYFMSGAWKWKNDYQVRISFWNKATKEPMPAAYAYLISIPMLPKHLLQDLNAYDIGFNWTGVWPEKVSPGMPIVGTGPFMATPSIHDEWVAGDHITLVKNPNYHWKVDKGKEVKFDKLVMRFFEDSTTMTLALKKGELDVAALPPQAYRSLKNNPPPNIVTYDGPKVTQYWTEIGISMNAAGPNPSRLDPAIRHAMHMATNKEYIVENYYLGMADPGSTIIPPINKYWHYEPTDAEKFHYNLSAAAALLEASGYRDINGDGIRECTIDSLAVQQGWVREGDPLQYQMLIRREYPEERDIAQYLEGEWLQIGIDINYMILDELQLSTAVYSSSYAYDTMIWYWSADIDPNYQLFVLSTAAIGGWSDCKYSNPAYDENYTLSVATLDREQRKVYVDNCQKIFYNDSTYIVLAYVYQTYAWRNDTFTGWGDWRAHPGRSVDNFWMGNPLYFDLTPTGQQPTPPKSNDWVPLAVGAGVAAAVVIAVVALVLRGKKKGGPPKEKEDKSPLGD